MSPTAPEKIQNTNTTPDREPEHQHNIIPDDDETPPTESAPVLRVGTANTTQTPVPTVPEEKQPDNPITFDNSTGPAAQNRRRRKRATTAPKNKKSTRNNPKRQPSTQQIHMAAHLDANFLHQALHGNAFNPDTNQLAEYPELAKCSEGYLWVESCKDEFGRLRIVAAYRPEKENPRRIRFTVGGNLIHYLGQTSTKAADLLTVKLLLNSVLSTPGAQFMTIDIHSSKTVQYT